MKFQFEGIQVDDKTTAATRPQLYNMLSGFSVCWVDDHQSSYLLLPKRFISLVHRGWIHLSSLFSAARCSVFKTFFG